MAERNEKKKMAVVLLVLLLTGVGIYGLVLFLGSLQVTALDDSAYNLRKCFVGVNNYILGREYSRLCFELLSENPRDSRMVVLMDSSSTGTGKNTMFWGMRETLDEKIRETGWGYEIKIQAVSIDSSNAFMTEETIRKLLVTEEEQPDILICLSEMDTRRAYEAVVDYMLLCAGTYGVSGDRVCEWVFSHRYLCD